MLRFLKIFSLFLILVPGFACAQISPEKKDVLKVKHTKDFDLTGDGSASNWNNAEWFAVPQRNSTNVAYQTQVKVLYSDSGIYCLYRCEDKKITATLKEDFLDLWNEDVVEAFFWTDESVPLYFEY